HFGSVYINCPDAACDITLGGMTVDKVTSIITSTTQNDSIKMDDDILKTFTLTTGGGNDTVVMGNLDQNDGEELIFAGKTTINLGDGDDSLTAGVSVHNPIVG